MSKKSDAAKAEARETLLRFLKPGATVFTILEHVSPSGMQRRIRVLVPYVREDGTVDFYHPNHATATLLGRRLAPLGKGDGIICNGCGMDMGFDLVYDLASALFADGYALKHRWL